jgi:hypothetical protein
LELRGGGPSLGFSLVFELALLCPQAKRTNKGMEMGITLFITDLMYTILNFNACENWKLYGSEKLKF